MSLLKPKPIAYHDQTKKNTKPTRPKTGTAAANKALDNAIPNPNGRRKHSGVDVIHAKSGLRDPLEK